MMTYMAAFAAKKFVDWKYNTYIHSTYLNNKQYEFGHLDKIYFQVATTVRKHKKLGELWTLCWWSNHVKYVFEIGGSWQPTLP